MVRLVLIVFWVLMVARSHGQSRDPVHIVQGSAVTLRAHSVGATSYLWFRNGEPINGFHDQRLSVSDAGIYTVMALGEGCDSDLSEPVEVIVDTNGGPMTVDMHIRNEPDQPAVLVGSTFTYQLFIINNGSNMAGEVVVKAVLPEHVVYEDVVGMYEGEVIYNPATREFTWLQGAMEPGQSQTLTIRVRAESEGVASQLAVVTSATPDSNPADNEAVATVNVIALNIPNTFTPNGDGLNDYFTLGGLESFPENRLVVFNRWGNQVYKASPYRGDWNGNSLSEGTYYYIVEVRLHAGDWQVFKGFITLIRNVSK